jgi:putative membrane protein
MQSGRLITLLTGTVALGLATVGWTQTIAPTTEITGAPGSSDASATGSTTAARSVALEGTDATFLRKAMEGGLEEAQRAQEAMRSAQRTAVRNLASMLFEEHKRSNEKLAQIASRKGWDVPAAAQSAENDQPRTVAGRDAGFDDSYLADEIRHHRETISLYRAQASSGNDPDLRQFATEALPSLEHHVEMLQGAHTTR